jgi:tRNA threonylcarbamoyladenosine biosynthesis protein TsaE
MSELKFQFLEEIKTSNLQQFHAAVLKLAQSFSDRSVVALAGPMGAGKTEFVKCLTLSQGIQGAASPTFAIHHRYQNQHQVFEHLDLYRLKNEDELETTGFWDFFSEPQGLILIEWPEKMRLSTIPDTWDLFRIEISVPALDQRILKLSKRSGLSSI